MQNGQVIGIGSFGISFTTSFVTSRVSTRVPPPPKNMGPPEWWTVLPPDEELEEDLFAIAPPIAAPFIPLIFADGFDEEDDLEDDFEDFDDELDPPFEFPSTKNNTATITTAARVTKTMIAVKRIARGMLYSSYP